MTTIVRGCEVFVGSGVWGVGSGEWGVGVGKGVAERKLRSGRKEGVRKASGW